MSSEELNEFRQLRFSDATYRETADELAEATAWLSSIGLRVDPTRIGEYQRTMRRFSDAHESGELARVLRERDGAARELINALLESTDLCFIHRVFGSRRDPELNSRLSFFVKGPVAYRDELPETATSKARDIGFELSLAAQLASAGIDITFHPEGDLRLNLRGREVYVECKRPGSAAKVQSRVREALRQLERRYHESSDALRTRGLVAVSAARVANPLGHCYRVASRLSLHSALDSSVHDFTRRHGRAWMNPRDKRTLGCLVVLRSIVSIEDEQRLSTGGYVAVCTHNLKGNNYRLIEYLAKRLSLHLEP